MTEPKLDPALLDDLAGSQGPPGLDGAPGQPGETGAPGADGAGGSAFLSGVIVDPPAVTSGASLATRAAANGASTASVQASDRASLSPARPLVARDLAVRVLEEPPPGGSITATFFVDSAGAPGEVGAQSFSCTITGNVATTDESCTSAGPLAIPAASTIWIRLGIGGGAALTTDPGKVYWGISVEPA